MTTALIVVGIVVAASLILILPAVGMSGACRDHYEDEAECAAIAEWNATHLKASNTAVSAPR